MTKGWPTRTLVYNGTPPAFLANALIPFVADRNGALASEPLRTGRHVFTRIELVPMLPQSNKERFRLRLWYGTTDMATNDPTLSDEDGVLLLCPDAGRTVIELAGFTSPGLALFAVPLEDRLRQHGSLFETGAPVTAVIVSLPVPVVVPAPKPEPLPMAEWNPTAEDFEMAKQEYTNHRFPKLLDKAVLDWPRAKRMYLLKASGLSRKQIAKKMNEKPDTTDRSEVSAQDVSRDVKWVEFMRNWYLKTLH